MLLTKCNKISFTLTLCTYKHALTAETNMSTLQCTGKTWKMQFLLEPLAVWSCAYKCWPDFIYELVAFCISQCNNVAFTATRVLNSVTVTIGVLINEDCWLFHHFPTINQNSLLNNTGTKVSRKNAWFTLHPTKKETQRLHMISIKEIHKIANFVGGRNTQDFAIIQKYTIPADCSGLEASCTCEYNSRLKCWIHSADNTIRLYQFLTPPVFFLLSSQSKKSNQSRNARTCRADYGRNR
jgi:hypothetical protein